VRPVICSPLYNDHDRSGIDQEEEKLVFISTKIKEVKYVIYLCNRPTYYTENASIYLLAVIEYMIHAYFPGKG
jgi:hypothetical protein